MSRLVQIVADYGPGDLAHAELIQRLELAAPDCVVHLTPVATGDTLAAGFCVARLALGEGPPDRIVAHDVGAPDAPGDPLWAGRSRGGVWIVGPDSGYSWSFAVDALIALRRLDVTSGGSPLRPREGLPVAVGHMHRRHPHALCGEVPRACVPRLPERVVAYVDAAGDITTTIAELPGALGSRVQVRIGDVSAPATLARLGRPVAEGELVVAAGEPACPFAAISLGGGSAAERFARPRPGTSIRLRPARLASASRARKL
ncbi:MAG TPA: hypothetical protein VH276_18425 [Solirubrobacteraceae bacterium]|nr:hypothetical protein [Solirubrobacteraceae bacterium]